MTISFETLAAEIREKAQSFHPENAAYRVFTDEAWQSLNLVAPNLVGAVNFSPRGNLLLLKGDEAIRATYRIVLRRDADAEGLAYYRDQIEGGMPILLFAGILGISDEAKRLGRPMQDFRIYRLLAYVLRLASISGFCRLFKINRLVFSLSRLLTERSRREDLARTRLDRVDPLCEAILSWHSALVRKLDQVDAAQLRLSRLEKSIESARAELSSVLKRMNAVTARAEVKTQAESDARNGAEHRSTVRQGAVAPLFTYASNSLICSEQELDQYYLAFEDHLRGSEQAMREKLSAYQPELDRLKTNTAKLPILDLGCGRGEWLEFVISLGFPAKGIDLNPVMVKASVDKGLDVSKTDLISALKAQPEQSLSAVTAFQVAEHLPFDVLFTCVKESWRVLTEGGMLLLETPNPENLMVASHTFYHDHTHRNPLTPAAMTFLLQYWGFKHVTIKRLNPYPESARVAGEGLLADRFNGHFCGPQDFAVIGYK